LLYSAALCARPHPVHKEHISRQTANPMVVVALLICIVVCWLLLIIGYL